jgi:hypothetical protein
MTRWLRDLWDRLTRRRPRMVVGVVCHLLRPEDIAALREMGVRHVRLSLYGDDYGSQWIDAALVEGWDVLAVSYRDPAVWESDRQRWPAVSWQYGNEPENLDATPPTPGRCCPGMRTDSPPDAMRRYADRMPPGQIFCFHSYGQPLTLAAERRLEAIRGIPRTIWCTETGQIGGTEQELRDTLRILDRAGVERTYCYALFSDHGYTMTPGQRAAIRAWIGGRA